jgi:glycosyltransferase involved in cell wall biosynthesis
MIKQLDWERYWIPAETAGPIEVLPPAKAGQLRRTTTELAQCGCLVMLGLPGMGKTTEMKLLARLAEGSGAHSDFVSIGLIPTAAQLEETMLSSPGRHAWLRGNAWALHLDGLDEAIIQQDELVSSLSRSLRFILADLGAVGEEEKAEHLNNLRVRISCRAAEWPSSFGEDLNSLFGDSLQVVQLEELEPEEAESAASAAGIPQQPWREIVERLQEIRADALTRRPITLRLLLSTYEKSGDVPTQQVPLYRRGVLALLEEANDVRRRNKLVGRLDTGSRFVVAGRVAAATTFSNSTSVSISARADAGDAEAVLVAEIAGGFEAIGGEGFRVGEAEIIELLRSALFRPLSESKFTWSHRTFSEFLAAYYLTERGLSSDQLLEFLGSSQDPQQRIPPQLHEVAAWVASMRQDFFKALVAKQPIILLSSDVAGVSDEDRSNLVKQLLSEFDEERLFDADWDLRRRYSKLRHPGLASDLLPYITERHHSLVARRAAIQIAVECKEWSLAEQLTSIALDPEESIHLRAQAVIGAGELGAPEVRSKLKPLALPGDPADQDDELRGWALAALWPNLISFDELLQALTPRKRTNLIGGYWRFRHDLELQLSPNESVKAVHWVRQQAASETDDLRADELLVTLLSAAWRSAGDDAVIEAFADFANAADSGMFSRLLYSSEFGGFIEAYASGDPQPRRRLAERVFGRLGEEGKSARFSIYGRWPLLVSADIPWLLDQLQNGGRVPDETLVETIVALSFVGGLDDRDDVWEAAASNHQLAEALENAFTCNLEGDLARFHRRDRRERGLIDEEDAPFDIREEAEKRLQRASDHVDEWWTFNLLFFVDDAGRSRLDEFGTDLTAQPLWRLLNPEQRATAVSWAYSYLTQKISPAKSWLGTNTFHRPAAAAYRAFRLLLSESAERFQELPSAAWSTWSHAILGVSANDDELGRRVRAELVAKAYEIAPGEFLRAVARLLLRAGPDHSVRETLRRLELAYDLKMAELLWRFARREKAQAEHRLETLKFLLEKNYPRARRAIVEAMTSGDVEEIRLEHKNIAQLAGEFLFLFPGEAWPYLADLDERNPTLAHDIFLEAHSQHGFGSFPLGGLTEGQLRDLYLWIDAKFPPPPEESDGDARWLGPQDQVQYTQRAVLKALVQRGTSAAVEAIRDLSLRLPDQTYLKWQLAEAEGVFQVRAWRSRSPGNVLRAIASYGVMPPVRSTKRELEVAASELLSARVLSLTSRATLSEPAPDIASPENHEGAPLSILSVATEWSSTHGGLSTLNRDLCVALAAEGHSITCLTINSTDADIQDASSHGVQLLVCPADPGVEGLTRLFLFPIDAIEATGARFVFGHDHITGQAAFQIAHRLLKVPYVHFVHTIPDEIEAFKSNDLYESLAKGADKAETQLRQCKQANLVVGVGPRIFSEIANKIGATPLVVQLRPGLVPSLMTHTKNAKSLQPVNVLFQGRLEHAALKGAPLAFEATAKVRLEPGIEPWDRPNLIMRGFEKDRFKEQCSVLGDAEKLKTFVKPRFFTTDEVSLASDFASASLLLMPSMKEGFGLIALEAISAGIPVLISANSGIAELLRKDPEVVQAIDPQAAQLSICDVEGPSQGDVVSALADQMKGILADRDAAFLRADQLRKDLGSVLTWRAAARVLVDQLREL